LILDLDRFKSVNASVGHDGADALLKSVGTRLGGRFDRSAIYRVGGDTFAIITRKPNDLQVLGNAVLQAMAPAFHHAGREIFLPTSVGVAAGDAAEDAQEFLTQAELAMVQAKRSGGGRAWVYSNALAKPPKSDAVALDTDLRRAIERGEIELHYQPIVRLDDNQIAGFEALLRWVHPKRGIIEPESFIPHAEQSGLIVPLGLVALKRAAQDLALWHKLRPLASPLFVSVNITWRQISDHHFMKEVETLLRRSNLPERTLALEVTESTVMTDIAAAQAALTRLHGLGAALAIDDFGTGHSQLSHLSRFPFDAVKVDKSFAPGKEKNGTPILGSILTLAHELGLEVVAEGIENAEQVAKLRSMACEYGQGFYFSAPMPATDIKRLLEGTR
jgi:diguanylate cyclase (GGDEF)-like protein